MPLKKIDLNQSPKDWIKSQRKYHKALTLLRNQGYISPQTLLDIRLAISQKTKHILTLIEEKQNETSN